MDLALCKLVYVNSPEILIDGVRDRVKNYHTVLDEFNKKFRLQVKQSRTVRSRFERLLLDYKSRITEKFQDDARESEIDSIMKNLVNLETEYYNCHRGVVAKSVNNVDAAAGRMIEKAINALSDKARVVNKSNASAGLQNDRSARRPSVESERLSQLQEVTNVRVPNGSSTGSSLDKSEGAAAVRYPIADSRDSNYGDLENHDPEEDEHEDEDEHEGMRQPNNKKYKASKRPESQPFTITNYFSDNKTFIMNGDGTQVMNGKSDLLELTDRVQHDLDGLKDDVGELSSLSRQIATVLKRATTGDESDRGY